MRRRKRSQPAPRSPHPDSRKEAELQRVLSLYGAVRRAEARLEVIGQELKTLDRKRRENAGYHRYVEAHAEHAEDLRAERAVLEEEIPVLHDDITTRLTALGDDALYLGPV